MKICYLSSISCRKGYAPAVHFTEVARYLSEWTEVHLIARDCPRISPKTTIYELGESKILPSSVHYSIKAVQKIREIIKKHKIDIIYARNPGSALIAIIAAYRYSVPVVCEVNGLPDSGKYYRSKNSVAGFLSYIISPLQISLSQKYAIKKSEHIVVVTEKLKEGLVDTYGVNPSRITIIPNGTNTDLFKPSDVILAKKELGLDLKSDYICFVGCSFYWHGVDNLIRSAPNILLKYPNTKLLVVGEGPMKEQLIKLVRQKRLEDHVIFINTVPYESVPVYINASMICVAPFTSHRNVRSGVSPLKIYEYGACGKPVIASSIPGLEFIETERIGILVEPDNTQKLAKAILELLGNKKAREEMGRRARQYVLQGHSWKDTALNVMNVCLQTLHAHNN